MKHLPLAALVASLLMAGCGKSEPDATAAGTRGSDDGKAAAASEKTGKADDAWDEKVQAYIKIGNRLRGFGSHTNDVTARWAAESAAKVQAGDFKEIRTDSHYFSDSDLEDLREARAMPGDTAEVDQAADALLAAAGALLPTWNELQDYNKAKRYEDDGGAKGKELLPKYRDGMAKLEPAVAALAARIDAAAKIAHEKAVARYKAEGKLLEMHTWEAMGSAEKVIDRFDSAEDFQDAARVKQADADIAAMEKSIAAMRAEHQKRKAAQEKTLPLIDRYDSVADELTEFAGEYRSARKDPSEFNDAVNSYNSAVDALNMMAR